MKIAILGAGSFGTALGGILADNGYDIDYYDSKLEREKLSDVLAEAKLVILCVPSKAAPYLLPYLPVNKPLLVTTKGILSNKAFEDFEDWMVLSGPGFAEDIKARKLTYFTITDERVRDIFATEYIQFDVTSDRNGVLMCGALKNVYAILAGIRGLKRDTAEWRKFVRDAAGEMREILVANGAKAETVDLACGLGDLKLTCGYPSRNYEYGDKLRINTDYQPEKTVEGLSAIKRIRRREIILPENVPLLREVMDGAE